MRLNLAFAALLLGGTLPAHADGLAGPYLAGRVASINSDYLAAADYFTQALAADPANGALLESAVVARIGVGDFAGAIPVAQKLTGKLPQSRLADMAVLAGLAQSGDFAATQTAMDQGRSAGPLVDGLFRAWTRVGAGQMTEASAEFDKVAQQKGLAPFALYHKALALALVGDYEGADAIFAAQQSGPIRATRRSIIAHAQILSQLERDGDAIKLLDETVGKDPRDTTIAALRADLEAGKTVPFTAIKSPVDGMAEVFLAVGSALSEQAAPDKGQPPFDTLMYARTAIFLRPDLTEAVLLAGEILNQQTQYDLAIATYDLVPQDSPDYLVAALGRADALIASGRSDAAIEALQQLAKSEPDRIEIWAALGDTLRRNDRFKEGISAYDHAIGLINAPAKGFWALYYARAICLEREKQWDKAEADFRMALKLSPDQPDVLNYLGYS
ncbi:MAG: tetratricopeptide repeat protein, partial [Rhodobacteraceae bacterium]|nr:tetratricopeptide repeat protein [Paracoccaceae bacterium]